jgi:hypothetical protein
VRTLNAFLSATLPPVNAFLKALVMILMLAQLTMPVWLMVPARANLNALPLILVLLLLALPVLATLTLRTKTVNAMIRISVPTTTNVFLVLAKAPLSARIPLPSVTLGFVTKTRVSPARWTLPF